MTWYDIPVHQEYINGIILVGAEVHRKSKWLNAVSVFATMDQIETIAAMNFVKGIQPVVKLRRRKNKIIIYLIINNPLSRQSTVQYHQYYHYHPHSYLRPAKDWQVLHY